MAKTNVFTKNENGATTLICGNCGAELVIPQHSTFVAGRTIAKDSGLGTVVAPTVTNPKVSADAKPLTADDIFSNPDLVAFAQSVILVIEDGGYLDVDKVGKRWVPAQALNMICKDKYGFHDHLKWKGYFYSWKVLINDLKKQDKLYREHDLEGVADHNRWYNANIAYRMAEDYIDALAEHLKTLKEHRHKGRKYVKFRCPLNNFKGVHVDKIGSLLESLHNTASAIRKSSNPSELLKCAEAFSSFIERSNFWGLPMSKAFVNAYKAVGGYYTMKDLILFEGCLMKLNPDGSTEDSWRHNRTFIDTENSLKALERKADEIVAEGVDECGYKLLGLLKDFLSYNKFDYERTKENWRKQSEMRRLARSLSPRRSRK